jgi:phytanoyl-CoA hydroxylase
MQSTGARMHATPVDALDVETAVDHWRTHGYARLGPVLDAARLTELRDRADAIMRGEVVVPGLFFQHDARTGRYEDLEHGKGWEGPSLAYRKIEKLERDDVFRRLVDEPRYAPLVRATYPGAAGATVYRAILMSKPAGGGTPLPWHQDGGQFWGLDREPVCQIWTALDDAPEDGGCVEVLPGSHRAGLATPLGGVVPAALVAAEDADARAVSLPVRAGEALLLHNHVWHRSARSLTGAQRRAFSVCYLDAATRCRRRKGAPRTFFSAFADAPI